MNIVARPQNALKALAHLTGVLEQVAVVDSDTANYLRRGSVIALAPTTTSTDQLHDFGHGGLLERQAPVGALRMEPVSSTAPILAHELHQLLHGAVCLIQDPLKTIEQASAQDGDALLIDNALFYRDRHCLQSVADCERAIRKNTYSWHFLLLVGIYPIEAQHTFRSVVQQAKCIVVGAYDGESYLIWRPSGAANPP